MHTTAHDRRQARLYFQELQLKRAVRRMRAMRRQAAARSNWQARERTIELMRHYDYPDTIGATPHASGPRGVEWVGLVGLAITLGVIVFGVLSR